MKKAEVELGATYLVKVSGKVTPVSIVAEHHRKGWTGINLRTNRTVRILSAQRLRRRVEDSDDLAIPTGAPAPETAEAAIEVVPEGTEQEHVPQPAENAPLCVQDEAAANDAPDAAGRPVAQQGAREGHGNMSLLDAAAKILRDGKQPMGCTDMVELVVKRGLWTPPREGKTPAGSLNAAINREIRAKGDASRFVRHNVNRRGLYIARQTRET